MSLTDINGRASGKKQSVRRKYSHEILKIFSFKEAPVTNEIHKDLKYWPLLLTAAHEGCWRKTRRKRNPSDGTNQKCNDRPRKK